MSLYLKFYAMGITRQGMALFRHRLARVKVAGIELVQYAVAVPNRDKCKGAATEAITDMVGFRDDNVIPTAAFYRTEIQINFLAEVCQDPNSSVRLAAATLLGDWVTTLPDRYCTSNDYALQIHLLNQNFRLRNFLEPSPNPVGLTHGI